MQFGTGNFSVSFWLNATRWGGVTQGVVGQKSSDSDNGWQVYDNSQVSTNQIGIRIGAADNNDFFSTSAVITGSWQYWTFVENNGTGAWYLNGAQNATGSFSENASSSTGNFNMGYAQTWGGYYDGLLDEIRVSKIARSSDWIAAEYNNQSSPATFVTVGQEQSWSSPVPIITSVTPTPAPYEGTITIAGSGFGASQGSSTVTLNGSQLTPTAWSDAGITLTLPSTAVSGSLVITAGGISSAPFSLTVLGPPTISGVSPGSGVVGAVVTITGSGFGSPQGSSTITLNGASMTPTSWSNTAIVAPVPAGATSGSIVVSVGGFSSNGVAFTVADPAAGYYRAVTIPYSQVPNTDQVNFPVLISGTYPFLANQANGGRVLNSNGDDIIFTSDAAGQNLLNFEVESYNSTSGAVVFWVCVPLLSHTVNTTIYIWYGIPGLNNNQANPSGVWDNNYVGVWHLPNGVTLSANDSTANGLNATISGAVAVSGQIDGAAGFNGSSNISESNIGAMRFGTGNFSVSFWLNAMQWGGVTQGIVGQKGSDSDNGWQIYNNSQLSTNQIGIRIGAADNNDFFSTSAVTTGRWQYWTFVENNSIGTWYLNGVQDATRSFSENASSSSANFYMGYAQTWRGYYNGLLDEVRVSNIARSSDWIATEYNNQSSPATFATMGQEFNSFGALPTISSVSPNPALSGQWITISGVGFGASQGSSSLTVSGTILTPRTWTDSAITFNLPSAATSGPLSVTVGGMSSASVPFINLGTNSTAAPAGQNCPNQQAGQLVAWAWPTQTTTLYQVNYPNGTAAGTSSSGTMSLSNTPSLGILNQWWGVAWTGFQAPSLPPNATINGIYAAGAFGGTASANAVDVAGFYSYPLSIGENFEPDFLYSSTGISGEACSGDISQPNIYAIPPVTVSSLSGVTFSSFVYSTMNFPAFNASLAVSQPGLAVYYTPASGEQPQGNLYVVDPYRSPLSGSPSISAASVISAINGNYSGVQANGLITDGTATAIAVYASSVSSPVTFTGTGGVTFVTYGSSFLSSAPASGSSSCSSSSQSPPSTCTVTTVIQNDQNGQSVYYSFVLVQAPPQSGSVAYGNQTASVTAAISDVTSSTAELSLGPTPVVLVHGLWGNATSLTQILDVLAGQPTWNWAWANSIYPVLTSPCYSLYLPFDATSDTLAGSGNGCEFTAQTALLTNIQTIQQSLDTEGYVGACLNANGPTLAACLSGDGEPLGPPGNGPGGFNTSACAVANPSTPSCGAVASLAPNSPDIASLPAPNIPRSQWFAIGADWQDNNVVPCNSQPCSMLRSFLNNMLQAIQSPQFLDELVGELKQRDNRRLYTYSTNNGRPAPDRPRTIGSRKKPRKEDCGLTKHALDPSPEARTTISRRRLRGSTFRLWLTSLDSGPYIRTTTRSANTSVY